jgi:hypothetical protein
MNTMFEQMNEAFRGAVDAGRRMQETWFDTMTDATKRPAGFEQMTARAERVTKEWVPFATKNVETFAQSCDVGVRAGQEVVNAACDVMTRSPDGDYVKGARRFFDAGFDAVRVNVDNLAKTGARTLENCSAFAQSVFADEPMHKTAPKSVSK